MCAEFVCVCCLHVLKRVRNKKGVRIGETGIEQESRHCVPNKYSKLGTGFVPGDGMAAHYEERRNGENGGLGLGLESR